MFKNAWGSICEFLPAYDISIKYVKRGSTNRVRLTRGIHVLLDYPYHEDLSEIDYACLLNQVLRMAFK